MNHALSHRSDIGQVSTAAPSGEDANQRLPRSIQECFRSRGHRWANTVTTATGKKGIRVETDG